MPAGRHEKVDSAVLQQEQCRIAGRATATRCAIRAAFRNWWIAWSKLRPDTVLLHCFPRP